MNKRYILKLYSRDSLKTMSKSKKKLYKLLLTALATNLLMGKILLEDSKAIINDLEKLLEETYPAEHYDDIYIQYREYFEKQLLINKIFKLTEESSYDTLIEFTRKILNDLIEKNVSVYKREEVEKYIDIVAYIKNIDSSVMWIGIHFEAGIYPFTSEKLVWADFKVIWNMFAKYHKASLDDWISSIDNNMEYERMHDKNSREIQYIDGTMERYVLISCITFIESFLYNIRIVIKNNPIFKIRIKEKKLSNVLQNDKINDIQIIEDILFEIYPDLKGSVQKDYQVYKELLKLRYKYIHISVRENGDRYPEMNELLSSSGLNIERKVKYALDIVDKINEIILESEEINLLWWRKEEQCNFEELELFRIVK
ncbi:MULTISPECIES: hypothetical protein [unclassified Clostridium]|uniref:hypothetical protein n=1 Tax=unclassified Clostridium TaxID=2614128 RepID=UPI00207A33C2|nr:MULTISPECIES: hypothetical protein [unclassified Clostridium]